MASTTDEADAIAPITKDLSYAVKAEEQEQEQLQRYEKNHDEDLEKTDDATAPAVQGPKSTFADRMARFRALQAKKAKGREETAKAQRHEIQLEQENQGERERNYRAHILAHDKLAKDKDPQAYERKRQWDYTVDESESWDKRVKKKTKNHNNTAFSDYQVEANKAYKRQIKQMGKVDMELYATQKAERLQRQVKAGLLELVETSDGDVFTIDSYGRVNTLADEPYKFDHKPTKEAVDRLVGNIDKSEAARLKARAARGLKDDDSGDVTYINEKNKQFNEKLARFFNKYTTEIRESFERGTAI